VCISAISQHHRTQAGKECKKKPLLAEEEGERNAGALRKKTIILLLPVMSSIFSDGTAPARRHGGRLGLIFRTVLGG